MRNIASDEVKRGKTETEEQNNQRQTEKFTHDLILTAGQKEESLSIGI